MTIEQLRYETGAQQRRHAAESAAQQQRITLLEGQLAESQREADMFHQASVENNSELTVLRNQVTGPFFFFFKCSFLVCIQRAGLGLEGGRRETVCLSVCLPACLSVCLSFV